MISGAMDSSASRIGGLLLWVWRGLLAAALAAALLSFSYLAVAVIAAWAATELLAR